MYELIEKMLSSVLWLPYYGMIELFVKNTLVLTPKGFAEVHFPYIRKSLSKMHGIQLMTEQPEQIYLFFFIH